MLILLVLGVWSTEVFWTGPPSAGASNQSRVIVINCRNGGGGRPARRCLCHIVQLGRMSARIEFVMFASIGSVSDVSRPRVCVVISSRAELVAVAADRFRNVCMR